MQNAINYLKILNFDNKKWITDLKNKICENGKYVDKDITTAITNFISIKKPEDITTNQATTIRTEKKKLLYKLYENKNIGGLIDDQEIEFSPFFTLIYGKNGSGKSSYYKALKHTFLEKQNLRPNIHSASNQEIDTDTLNRT